MRILEKNNGLTDFQRKVYKAVLKIPRGQTRSYKWVAEEIKKPGAYRAVGQVLKKNPYTVTVPCHRVINEDDSPGGYSKGINKKLRLLEKEGTVLFYGGH